MNCFYTRTLTVVLFLLAAGQPYGMTEVDEIIVVSKTHVDVGFTEMERDVIYRYRTSMIDKALDVIEESNKFPKEQQFTWTLPGWPLMKVLEDWPGQTEERKQRLMEAFKNNRLIAHALPYTLHTESLEPEDIVHGLWYAAELCRQSGLPLPRGAKMTDVPSHSWIIPTILKHAGVDFLHLGCNPASQSPEVPRLFWWEGPDGSRVLTWYDAAGYGSGLVPPEDWPYKVWLMMNMTYDNQGPPNRGQIRNILNQARKELPKNTKVRMGTLEDFYDALMKTDPDIPVIRGDMPDTWIHGVMAMPIESSIARTCRPKLEVLNTLATQAEAWGVPGPHPAPVICNAREHSLRFGEHTWGMDYKRSSKRVYGEQWQTLRDLGAYEMLESSFVEKGSHAQMLKPTLTDWLMLKLKALAAQVNSEKKRVLVYNPLPCERDAIATIIASEAVAFYEQKPETDPIACWLRDMESGEIVAVNRGTGHFLAKDLPPCGYRTFEVLRDGETYATDLNVDKASGVIENTFYKITIDQENGTVASLIDKRTGLELVDTSQKHGMGQYLYERFSAQNNQKYLEQYDKIHVWWSTNDLGHPNLPEDVPYRAAVAKQNDIRILKEQESVTVILKSAQSDAIPHAVTTKITLYRQQPYIDFAWSVDSKQADAWPEAGWLCFPFNVEQPSFKLWRLGGVMDPAKDVVPNCNKDVYCLNGGMAVLDPQGNGVGLIPLDSPLVSLERPGLWKFSKDFTPTQPMVYVNLYNNQWGTNFQQWIEGSWTSRVRVWSIHAYDAEKDLVTPTQEARFPLETAVEDGPAGKLPVLQAGISCSRKGVAITAFGPNPDGGGTLLRLWEQAGSDEACVVQIPAAMDFVLAYPCDLRGRITGKAIKVKKGELKVSLQAYAPTSFLLDPKGVKLTKK